MTSREILFPIVKVKGRRNSCFMCGDFLLPGSICVELDARVVARFANLKSCITCHEIYIQTKSLTNWPLPYRNCYRNLAGKKPIELLLDLPTSTRAFKGSDFPKIQKHIIDILELSGGMNVHSWTGSDSEAVYFIDPESRHIKCKHYNDNLERYTVIDLENILL